MPRPVVVLLLALVSTVFPIRGETSAPAAGPDPREIPVPPIKTPFPARPGPAELPARPELPDALTTAQGKRVRTAAEWPQRRQEILDVLSYYAVGHAPPPPGNVRGHELKTETLAGGKYQYRLVHLSFGPQDQLGFDIGVFTPAGSGPFPVVLSPAGTPPGATPLPQQPKGPTQGKGTDVLLIVGPAASTPAESAVLSAPKRPIDAAEIAARSIALERGYAYVVFNYTDCGEDTTLRHTDGSWVYRDTRFFPAYPAYDWGLVRAWAWGVSRIIDYLQTDHRIDPTKIIVTGASRTGKSAMVAAAFDERIALGAPVVTGGGGIGVYRYAGDGGSETLDVMVKKYPNWFSPHLHEFWGQVDRLPFDQHWFIAACAPRAFIALEGSDDVISSPQAVRASLDAAREVYALFGAEDKLAVHYAHHGHAFTAEDWNAMLDFADKELRESPARK
jgi:hypothetical protein